MQKYALRRANAIITDSNCSKKDIVKHAGVLPEKISVVYLAAGEEFKIIENLGVKSKEIREKYSMPDKFVLYVGDVTWNKNLVRLVEAVKDINVPLVMVGKALVAEDFDKNNPWNKDLVKVQDLAKEDKTITRLGFVPTEDLAVIYNLATVFAMPSLYEGFGLPILEAMSCGCPVITTKEGSLVEVAGEAALYVDAYSKDSIGKGIQEVFGNSILQKKLMQDGLKRVNEFSWEKTASQTLEVYKKVIEA
jgi:glycosyltransferase involved in cell wall biosynthesis